MPTRPRHTAAIAATVAAVAATTAVGIVATTTPEADAHGSTQVPASRTFSCRFEAPDNPMCAHAWEVNEQALFDWMEVNIADADDRHRELIPDGRLCSAGRDKYVAFDEPGDWPVTPLQRNGDGQLEVLFTNTAPHATAYYRIFLTQPGFDARSDLLTWDDLELMHDSGPLPAAGQNTFLVDLPDRAVPAILYIVWQRSDSPEAFYACSDVTIGDDPPPTTTTTTTAPPPTTTTTVPDPEPGNPASPIEGIVPTATVTSDWGAGACITVQVENTTSSPLTWVVHFEPDGAITSVWNAASDASEGRVTFAGEPWNDELAGGASTSFGMCIARG